MLSRLIRFDRLSRAAHCLGGSLQHLSHSILNECTIVGDGAIPSSLCGLGMSCSMAALDVSMCPWCCLAWLQPFHLLRGTSHSQVASMMPAVEEVAAFILTHPKPLHGSFTCIHACMQSCPLCLPWHAPCRAHKMVFSWPSEPPRHTCN